MPHQLASGVQLGPYRIESLLGAGGMGEVYRATDTRLGRTVAVKILPAHLRSSPDLQARFDREARTISQLTHPHICTLHDVGHENGIDFLVMELLEGEALAARLARGRVPLDQALRIGIEIASALDHAHRHGIVHRDLKPGNVMLTKSGAKLLDFGLAKLRRPLGVDAASAPTVEGANTAEGTLLGTLPYMAPEQLEGKEADARSDIWALGCVLYELVTRRRAFDGNTQAALIAAILEHHPASLASGKIRLPPLLEHITDVCLSKDPDERWQSAADVSRALDWLVNRDRTGGDTAAPALPSWQLGAAALLLLTVGAGLATIGWKWFVPQPFPAQSSHFTVSVASAGLTLAAGGLAMSPDGQTLVFSARAGDDDVRLYTRRLNDWEPHSLKGTENGITPFFSPDGAWIAFVANGKLKKLHLPDGIPQQLCPVGYSGHTRGYWGPDDRIIVGQWPGGLGSVSSEGGPLRPITPDSTAAHYLWPQMLPDGKTLLFTVREKGQARIATLSTQTGVIRNIVESGSSGRLLPSGHLAFEAEGHIRVVPFDLGRLSIHGAARDVVDDVAVGQNAILGNLNYDVSGAGVLAYLPASTGRTRPVWKDRHGNTTPMALSPRIFSFPSLGTEASTVTATVMEWPELGVWAGDSRREPLIRLTTDGESMCSIISPDGKWVVYSSGQSGWFNLFKVPTDGNGRPQRLLSAAAHQKPTSWSPDGKTVLFNEFSEGTPLASRDIAAVDLDQPGDRRLLVHGPAQELEAVFSPDGRWIAYQSDESGQFEVYVRPYPRNSGRHQVSVGGGMGPAWNPRGGELFYQTATALMAVQVINGSPVSSPYRLFAYRKSQDVRREFDVARDGDHFLFLDPATARTEISVITNWFEELKARVPVR